MSSPRPPLSLARRVGELDPADPWAQYEKIGAELAETVISLTPSDWHWGGKKALDFGCGAGRVLVQVASREPEAELWGCDIDNRSIEWMAHNLAPPLHPFLVTERPGIDRPDGFFNLIWAASVFTHLGATWSGWASELHRVLADDGILVVSFLGAGMWRAIGDGEWSEDRIGMCMLRAGQPWSAGGPTIFHSEWWLRERWGRAFDVLKIAPNDQSWQHGWIVLRKRPDSNVSPETFERLGADPREVAALQHNIEILHAEDRRFRGKYVRLTRMPQRVAVRWWLRRLGSVLLRVGGDSR